MGKNFSTARSSVGLARPNAKNRMNMLHADYSPLGGQGHFEKKKHTVPSKLLSNIKTTDSATLQSHLSLLENSFAANTSSLLQSKSTEKAATLNMNKLKQANRVTDSLLQSSRELITAYG